MHGATCQTRWHVMPDIESLVSRVTGCICHAARQAIAARGIFRIVLAGGNTPRAVYEALAEAGADWSCWQVYFGDERCLPLEHPDRNSAMAMHSWLGRVDMPRDNIHIIPAELGAAAAAQAYAPLIAAARPFDLVLLGMGEDGHTASLFPDQQHDPGAAVVAVHHAPKAPPERVSLGAGALGDTAKLLVLVTGSGKHAAVMRWQRGEALPVTTVCGHDGVDVYLDTAAAAG